MEQPEPYRVDPPCDSPQPILRAQEAIVELCLCGCGRPLRGRQEKYASKACGNRMYETARPRVLNASAGAPRERDLLTEWLALMSDGEARDCMQMAVDLQCLPQSASATLRRARAKGFRVVSDLPNGCVTRAHRYRLVLNG